MKKTLFIAGFAAATLLTTGCKKSMDNPFFTEWGTPYEIPDFGKIKTEHYMPAFEEGMKQQTAEIDAIVNNPEAPTFENTIEAYEYSGELLNKVSGVFFNLSECENSDEMEAIAEEVTPKLSAHGDNIALNAKLFQRIKAVYDQRESLNLNPEQMRLLEETYKGFVRSGANVPAEKQARFRQLNEQIASLTLRFAQNVLKATNAYQLVLDTAPAGITADQIAAAKEAAAADPATNGFVLALDRIQDPGNMGTILRIADWCGIRHIVCTADTVDYLNPKVIQASMGSFLRVGVHYGDLEEYLAQSKTHGKTVYGAVLGGDNVFETPLNDNAVLVIGNESKGISSQLCELVDKKIAIPNWGGTCESLNASVACAILIAQLLQLSISN